MCIGIVKDTCPPDDPSGVGELAQDAMTCGDQAGLVDPVRETGLLDAPERESLHAVAELAAWICGTPMAAVSLVQDQRQFFAGSIGLDVRETDRDSSFCAVAMETPDQPMLVPDALADERFAGMSLVVGDPHVRSYAGVPLIAPEGVALGAVCALGSTGMDLSAGQVSALQNLASVAVELLQARREATRHVATLTEVSAAREVEAAAHEQFRTVFEHAPVGMSLVDLSGRFLRVNEAFATILGRPAEDLVGLGSWEVSVAEDAANDEAVARELQAGGRPVSLREKQYLRPDGTRVPALVTTSLVRPPGFGQPVLLNQVESVEQRRAAESRLLELQSVHDGIISVDSDGLVTSWNRGAERLLGHPAGVMLGRRLDRIIPAELLAAHASGLRRVTSGGPARLLGKTVEVPAIRADGRRVLVELSLSGWTQDERAGYTAVLRDVTARRRAELLADLVRHAASTANQAVTFVTGASKVIREVCDRLGWVAGHGWTEDDPNAAWAVTQDHQTDAHTADGGCGLLPLAAAGSAPSGSQLPFDSQTRLSLTREGLAGSDIEPVLVGCRIASALAVPVLTGGSAVGMLAFYLPEGAQPPDSDLIAALEQIGMLLGRVVERQRASALLRQQADHDPLTDLANRRVLLEAVSSTQAGCEDGTADGTAALVLMDLDRFGRVNSALGYTVGDLLLMEAADRLQAAAAPGDLVARLSADEFVVLVRDLPAAPPAGADDGSDHNGVPMAAAHEGARLLAALTGPVEVAGQRLTLSASVGVCPIGPDHAALAHYPAAVLRDADAALRHAKQHGKGRVKVFDAAMRTDVARRLADEADLAAAIATDALVVHYQPIVDLETARPVGAEALVRWPRPGHGLVRPDLFIPLAEASGLIVELGRWVLNQACRDAARWGRSVPALATGSVSVNVSARQLTHPRFVQDVAQALARSGLPASRLVLEITESAVIEDRDAALGVLTSLRERGVRLALDDFGTGYCSLGYVQALPVDIIKIDKSFVDPITGPGHGTALSEVVLKLAAASGLRVIAEGIETSDQADALLQLGCHSGQGYTWSRPLPVDQLHDALRQPLVATTDTPQGQGAACAGRSS